MTRISFIIPTLGGVAGNDPLGEVALLVQVVITSDHRLHRALEPLLHHHRVVPDDLPETNRTEIVAMKVCPQTMQHGLKTAEA